MEELITELLFADDCALLAHTESALQHIVNRFSNAAKNFGLTISLKKTEVLYQPPPREAYTPPHISIDGTKLNAVEHFTYLGSVFCMPQSARILTSACPKPAVPWEDCQRGYGRVTRSASPQRQLHIHCRTSSYPFSSSSPTRLPFKEEIFPGFVRFSVISSGFFLNRNQRNGPRYQRVLLFCASLTGAIPKGLILRKFSV